MIYTGIGSRKTPWFFIKRMSLIGKYMASQGYVLRSGAAEGADTAFETGCDSVNGKKEIYLPWKNFNNSKSILYDVCDDAIALAQKYHPKWNSLSRPAQLLMGRNSYQILGGDLKTPCNFVVCWTPDGCNLSVQRSLRSGGTGQAISIALDYKIPVFNLANVSDYNDLRALVTPKH